MIQQTGVDLYTVTSENEPVLLGHYGGSARAVDGDPKRNRSHVGTSRKKVFVPRYTPRHFAPGTVAASAATTEATTNRAKSKAPNRKKIGRPVDCHDDVSSGSENPLRDKFSGDDESSEGTTHPSTSGSTTNTSSPRRVAPKRKASRVVKKYFTQALSSSESSDNQEESQGNNSCNDKTNENSVSLKTQAKSSAAGRGTSTKLSFAKNGNNIDEGCALKNASSKRQRLDTKKKASKGGPKTIAKKRATHENSEDEKSGQDDRVEANSAPSVNRRTSRRHSSIKNTMYRDASDSEVDSADDDDASSTSNASVLEDAMKEKESLKKSKLRNRNQKLMVGKVVEKTTRRVAARQGKLDDDIDPTSAMKDRLKTEVVDLADSSDAADEDHHLQFPANVVSKSALANPRCKTATRAATSTKKRAQPVQEANEDKNGDEEKSGEDNDFAYSANQRAYRGPLSVKKPHHSDASNAEDDGGGFSTSNSSLLDGSKKGSLSASKSKTRNQNPSNGKVVDDVGTWSTKTRTIPEERASKEESPRSLFRSRKQKSSQKAKTPMIEGAEEIRSLPNSPFRPPRRKSPAVKAAKSPVNKVLDLTGDGEFGFLS
jgi:hypothetical protein